MPKITISNFDALSEFTKQINANQQVWTNAGKILTEYANTMGMTKNYSELPSVLKINARNEVMISEQRALIDKINDLNSQLKDNKKSKDELQKAKEDLDAQISSLIEKQNLSYILNRVNKKYKTR